MVAHFNADLGFSVANIFYKHLDITKLGHSDYFTFQLLVQVHFFQCNPIGDTMLMELQVQADEMSHCAISEGGVFVFIIWTGLLLMIVILISFMDAVTEMCYMGNALSMQGYI